MPNSSKPLVLIADDDVDLVALVAHWLSEDNFRVKTATSKVRMFELLAEERPSVLLLDLRFGEHDGLEILRGILQKDPELIVVMFTAFASITTAVSAMKMGAFDYLTKPIELQRLRAIVTHGAEKAQVLRRSASQQQSGPQEKKTRPLLGDCSEMVKLRELISQVASTDATVLILGESGTGKELVARSLHEQSSRNKSPFVPVNMAALPKELAESTLFGHEKGAFTGADQRQIGCCEAADKGTLFLDEIGEMELGLQSKLLRFLQERTLQRVGSQTSINVDVRVLAATNRDLAQRVEDGEFRQDLYYRLHVVPVHVPPLSERKEDIPLLAARFLDKAASRYQKDVVGFSKEAIQQLKGYAWPGNVRQLENMVERLVILNQGSTIEADALPEEIQQQSHSNNENTQPTDDNSELRPIEEIEKQAILDALKRAEGNVRAAAKLLGLGHATVYRKIKAYQIDLKK